MPDDQMDPRQAEKRAEAWYGARYEGPLVADAVASEKFPKDGPNRFVSELDLRAWEILFIESLKVLNLWDPFRDIAHLHGNQDSGAGAGGDTRAGLPHELWIEFFW